MYLFKLIFLLVIGKNTNFSRYPGKEFYPESTILFRCTFRFRIALQLTGKRLGGGGRHENEPSLQDVLRKRLKKIKT